MTYLYYKFVFPGFMMSQSILNPAYRNKNNFVGSSWPIILAQIDYISRYDSDSQIYLSNMYVILLFKLNDSISWSMTDDGVPLC